MRGIAPTLHTPVSGLPAQFSPHTLTLDRERARERRGQRVRRGVLQAYVPAINALDVRAPGAALAVGVAARIGRAGHDGGLERGDEPGVEEAREGLLQDVDRAACSAGVGCGCGSCVGVGMGRRGVSGEERCV